MSIKERMSAWRDKAARRFAMAKAIRANRRAAISGEGVGFGLAFVGGVLAVVAIVGVLFVPVATFPTIDAEVMALFGIIMLVAGLVIFEAE